MGHQRFSLVRFCGHGDQRWERGKLVLCMLCVRFSPFPFVSSLTSFEASRLPLVRPKARSCSSSLSTLAAILVTISSTFRSQEAGSASSMAVRRNLAALVAPATEVSRTDLNVHRCRRSFRLAATGGSTGFRMPIIPTTSSPKFNVLRSLQHERDVSVTMTQASQPGPCRPSRRGRYQPRLRQLLRTISVTA